MTRLFLLRGAVSRISKACRVCKIFEVQGYGEKCYLCQHHYYLRTKEKALLKAKARYEANRERIKQREHERRLMRKSLSIPEARRALTEDQRLRYRHNKMAIHRLAAYGMTPEDVTQMLSDQYSACAICWRHLELADVNVDHCHTTGEVRGILCKRCNSGLGFFRDNQRYLASAIEYLKASQGF